MKKSNLQKLMKSVAFLLAICFIFGSSQTAFAADNSPYGYTYDDAVSGHTLYKYYSYNSSKSTYVATREFYSAGTKVCQKNGTVITNLSAGSGSRYNGFASGGTFYMITSKGELLSIDKSNKITTVLSSGAISLSYTSDELANIVKTSSGSKYISTLKEAPEKDDDITPVPTPKAANRVEIYTNSAGEMVYDAYKANKLVVSIITSPNGKKVLNATVGVRLSDVVKGAKFMGLDSSYNVYLYELNGTLYRFNSGNWYSAEKISLSSAFKTFTTNDNGFIEKVVTKNATYTIKQLTTSNKWKAKKTYAVSKDNYATLYIKNSTKSHTLLLEKGVLYLNGKAIALNVKKFGFVSAKKICYISKNTAYTATITAPAKGKKICAKAVDLKKNSVGLSTKVTLSNGKTKKLA